MITPWAAQYLGISYKDIGRTRDGVDCWGLVVLVYAEQLGIELIHHIEVEDPSDSIKIARLIFEEQEELQLFHPVEGEAREGDAVLFRRRGMPPHVGIYVGMEGGHRYVLHTTQARGQSFCERVTSWVFEHGIADYYRYQN